MSVTFIKIDSLQHLEMSETYPTNQSKICVTTFTVLIVSDSSINFKRTCKRLPPL